MGHFLQIAFDTLFDEHPHIKYLQEFVYAHVKMSFTRNT